MKNVVDPKKAGDIKANDNNVSNDSRTEQPNNAEETRIANSGSVSVSSNEKKKVSREDIELVQNLIERCIQFYMNKNEVVKTLLSRARIDPRFTKLVWQKLEEENAGFFRAYYIRLKMKKQIILFNQLLEHQYHLMKYPVPQGVPLAAPLQNAIHPMPPVNNIPMGYPVIQQPDQVPTAGQSPHIDPKISSCHVVTGVPAPANFHLIENNINVNDTTKADDDHVSPIISPPSNEMSDMPVSPASVASEIPPSCGIEVDTFTSNMATSFGELQLPPDNGAADSKDSLRSLAQIPWDFSLSGLTADLSNLEDLGDLGNDPGSPFLPSDSDIDIVLDSEAEDLDKFFAESDSVPGQCFPSDEEKA
ncbi:hypothetical protein ACJIZ3_018552 [Penstemon smallii]|uniref:Uncharacterized protein n=1 Tax=Penstemon smallii TaxID=265156 RepID=A0ABD3SZJ5_9LAMI